MLPPPDPPTLQARCPAGGQAPCLYSFHVSTILQHAHALSSQRGTRMAQYPPESSTWGQEHVRACTFKTNSLT
eukprot:1148480-Pelagomonas_calceolata.AAC.5